MDQPSAGGAEYRRRTVMFPSICTTSDDAP
jgi:hypothetical protein